MYHIQPDGSVKVACVACQELTPLWGAVEVRVGRYIRIPNPNFMCLMADGTYDSREFIRIPKIVAKGPSCKSCGDEYLALTLKHGNRTFLELL